VANEILLSGIADLRVGEVLSGLVLQLLADRNALPNHPALVYAGDAAGQATNVLRVPHLGLGGYNLLAATADGDEVANTALTDGVTDITVARYSKAYEASDLSFLTDPGNILGMQRFAEDAVITTANTLTDLICNVTDGFTATVGSSGVDFSLSNFMAAYATLDAANVQGPYLCVLHAQQFNDLMTDVALNVGGTVQWNPAAMAIGNLRGTGYKGNLHGVDIVVSNRVPTANAGADRAGAMFGRGALVWGDASVVAFDPVNQMLLGNKILFERSRNARKGLTAMVTHAYLGVSKAIDAAGVSIITDA
jgi:hypothetical protein